MTPTSAPQAPTLRTMLQSPFASDAFFAAMKNRTKNDWAAGSHPPSFWSGCSCRYSTSSAFVSFKCRILVLNFTDSDGQSNATWPGDLQSTQSGTLKFEEVILLEIVRFVCHELRPPERGRCHESKSGLVARTFLPQGSFASLAHLVGSSLCTTS